MKIWFQKRGHPGKIIENEMKKVNFPSCNKIQRKKSKGIPFVVTYHPLLKQLEGILRRNKYLLNMNAEVKQTFTLIPMVSNRSARKLSSYLIRAKLYPINRIVGSKGCGQKRCEVCVNVCETDTFSSTVTGETYKINHKLNCDDRCLIYLFTCECCGKYMLEKPLGSLGLGGTAINVMIGNILGMRIVSKNIYLDVFIVGNIQISLKLSR